MFKVNDIITRSPHLSESFKRKYRKEVRDRMRKESGKFA